MSRAVLALGAPQLSLVCVKMTAVREGGCSIGHHSTAREPSFTCSLHVSAAVTNCALENGHRGDTVGALRPDMGVGSPHAVAACSNSHMLQAGQHCPCPALSLSPQESEQCSGVQIGPLGTCLSPPAERSGARCRVMETHWGSGQLGARSQLSLYMGDFPWEGPFTSQAHREVTRLLSTMSISFAPP